MTNNNIEKSYDTGYVMNHMIKNIEEATWFRTMNHYPKTLEHVKLLFSIVDKIRIFKDFDLIRIVDMDSNKLNIVYAILRITNKAFNKYVDHVVKKIFRDEFEEIFKCSQSTYYNLFFDQLTQDLDHFVCLVVQLHYPEMDEQLIKIQFIKYLKSNFKKVFYENIIKKLKYDIDKKFYQTHDKSLTKMINNFVTYTKNTLLGTHKTMKFYLEKIFHDDCSEDTANQIIVSLKKHTNLGRLFSENCMEIDLYCERKLDNELECYNSVDKARILPIKHPITPKISMHPMI